MDEPIITRTTTYPNPWGALARIVGDEVLLIAPERVAQVEVCLAALAQHAHADEMLSASADLASEEFWPPEGTWQHALRPYVVKDGVLQIPVKGVLLHNFPWALGSWATGYKYIQRAFERGLSDDNVKGIALICDTPGGQVAGCFELTDQLFENRSKKPMRAFAADSAYSAGYAIASVPKKCIVTRSGGVGSVGVVTMHADYSKMLDDAGVKVTFIFAGKHKVDGNAYEPLSADVKARIQERINETYGVFVASVARNRGLTEKEVRATEALCFTATQAVSEKFADSIGAFDDAIAEFSAELSAPQEDDNMTTQDKAAVDEAAINAARTEAATEATATAGAAAKKRVGDILALDEAKNRKAAAENIALNTDLSVDQAKALLATLPEAKVEATTKDKETPFDAAMSKDKPNVGASGEKDEEDENSAKGVLALAREAGVPGLRRAN